ncbi:hypothetical protein FQW43_22440 [Salmonella enterica subsp. enterica serovar Enteritidis]|nr:hypothetical protein [Salmonella enterica subsp. enterica serovar Enteritidis]
MKKISKRRSKKAVAQKMRAKQQMRTLRNVLLLQNDIIRDFGQAVKEASKVKMIAPSGMLSRSVPVVQGA